MPNIIKRDLIVALLRENDIEHKLPFFLSFIRSKMSHDDFDAIFISPGFGSSVSQTRRFAFVPMDIKGHSFLTFAKFKDIMKHYLNVWCIDYSMLKHKNIFNLSDLDCNDIIFQCGNRKGEIESATYYGRSEAVRELLSFLEKRKTYNATENDLVGRWQRRNGSPILIPQKKMKNSLVTEQKTEQRYK
ncbi:MAG: hypothetical protein IJN29_08100 [Akkermansia sp.]|nr:hypothetical protein [Akkermansia sp.]